MRWYMHFKWTVSVVLLFKNWITVWILLFDVSFSNNKAKCFFFFCCKYLSLCRKMHPYQNNTASPALLHVSIDMQELVGRSDKRIANPRWLPNIKHLKCCYISQHCYSENGFLKRFLHLNEALKKVSLFFPKIVNYHHYLHCQKTHGPLSTFFLPNDVVVYQGGAII